MKTLILLFCLLSSVVFGQNSYHQYTEIYTDSTRANRPIKVEIWEPEFSNSLPLILLSHGTGGNRLTQSWIAESLTKDGYLVMAFDHYGNTFDNPIPTYFVRYWERPLDVKFLLDELEKNQIWNTKIDFEKIGIIGFSLGGYTTMALAGAEIDCFKFRQASFEPESAELLTIPELGNLAPFVQEIDCQKVPESFRESRIKSFFALAPALGPFAQKESKKGSQLFILGAEQDKITPIATNAEVYHQIFTDSNYEVLPGEIGHYIFLNDLKNFPAELAIYFQDAEGVNRSQIHQEVLVKIKNHLKKTL